MQDFFFEEGTRKKVVSLYMLIGTLCKLNWVTCVSDIFFVSLLAAQSNEWKWREGLL